ncbi:MAG: DHA1 family tetracycline resistance protein-like MFS transporter [Halobacteriales archaeon]|jgi:DHA1 family tetracycline resistance protein-like MFS transporter
MKEDPSDDGSDSSPPPDDGPGPRNSAGEGFDPPVENRRRALAALFGVVFVDLLGFGILIPIIPLYAEAFGANEFVVGLLLASYSATQFVFAPILGRLSDERGRRPILLLSLGGSVIAWTLFGLANALWVLFLARLVAGAMGGNIATAQAYVADITPPEDRAKGLGLIGAAFGLGFVFGPAIGGIASSPGVLDLLGGVLPSVVPVTGFTIPSFVAAAITALNLAVAFVVLPETRREESAADERGRVERLIEALRNPALSGLVISFFVLSLAFSGMESMFVLFTKDEFGYGTTANGYLLAYMGVVVAIVQGGVVGRLTERYGERRVAVAGVAIMGLSLGALPFSSVLGSGVPPVGPLLGSLPTLSGGVLVMLGVLLWLAVGNGLANVSLTTLVSKNAAEETQGGAFGLTQSAGSIARTAGPTAAGALYAAIQFWLPFVVGGLLMLPVLYLLATTIGGSAEAVGAADD